MKMNTTCLPMVNTEPPVRRIALLGRQEAIGVEEGVQPVNSIQPTDLITMELTTSSELYLLWRSLATVKHLTQPILQGVKAPTHLALIRNIRHLHRRNRSEMPEITPEPPNMKVVERPLSNKLRQLGNNEREGLPHEHLTPTCNTATSMERVQACRIQCLPCLPFRNNIFSRHSAQARMQGLR